MSGRRVSPRGYTEPLLRVAAEGVSRLDEDGCESSGDIEGSRKRVEVIDVLVHQPVTQPPGAQHSWVSRMIPRRSARLTFSTAVPGSSPATRKKRGRSLSLRVSCRRENLAPKDSRRSIPSGVASCFASHSRSTAPARKRAHNYHTLSRNRAQC